MQFLLPWHQAMKVAWGSHPQGTRSTDGGSMGEPSSGDPWLLCFPRRRLRTASTTNMNVARNTPPATGINDQREMAGLTEDDTSASCAFFLTIIAASEATMLATHWL
mmetsp:Transcript_38318/g.73612  ORF Transcript_38318/g.73612 Transcript_38318/m.73612 type:complete len:107 (-) Transcript_38318:300-620(-)